MHYAIAVICKNGHLCYGNKDRDYRGEEYCAKCRAPLISKCPSCNHDIQGDKLTECPEIIYGKDMRQEDVPAYCAFCGKAFPWTNTAVKDARDLIDAQSELSDEEKEQLKRDVIELTRESAQQGSAIERFKNISQKAGHVFGNMLQQILVNVVTEAVKRQLWP